MRKPLAYFAILFFVSAGIPFGGCSGKSEQTPPPEAVPGVADVNTNPPPVAPVPPAPGSDPATVEKANKMRDDLRNNDR